MKILFCIYQLDYADHIALSYLSAIAKQSGHSTFYCDIKESDLLTRVAEIQPEVVAYSALNHGFDALVAAHKKARTHHEFVSIMGGPHPTFSPESFEESGVDAFCVGEGEYPFKEFLACVSQGESFADVANLITAKGRNAIRPTIRNLDELPLPDRDLVLANSFLKNTPKKTFYATRGCPYKCTYCANDFYHELYRGKGPFVRRFSVEYVLREIETVLGRYRMDFIKFGDDLFAMRADGWLREFAEKYPKRIGIPFNCFLRFDRVDEEMLQLLKQAGCYSVHLSVDSSSKHVRDVVLGRKMKDVDIAAKLSLIRDYGINTWVNFMLAAPDSTLQDDLDSIELARAGRATYTAFSMVVPTKGTALYDYAVSHGLIDPATHSSDMSGCAQESSLNCFTAKDKQIRLNIYYLGAIIAKLPYPLYQLALALIRIIPPNRFFDRIRQRFYTYNIENTIFKLHDVALSASVERA